jgi:hypothetical protein
MWPWLPTLLVIIVTAVALTGASSSPAGVGGRRVWMISIMVCGGLAIVGSVWQAQKPGDHPAALSGTTASPESLSKKETTVADPASQVRTLEDRLESRKQIRRIAPDIAEELSSYLQQFGTRRVIVSCIPDDLEAYQYANQLVIILKAGHWDARGPEVTKIFGDMRVPGINFYVNADDHSDTAKILLDSFAKFNVPYQSRVTPSHAIPDAETVELFIGSLQSDQARAGGD